MSTAAATRDTAEMPAAQRFASTRDAGVLGHDAPRAPVVVATLARGGATRWG